MDLSIGHYFIYEFLFVGKTILPTDFMSYIWILTVGNRVFSCSVSYHIEYSRSRLGWYMLVGTW